MGNLVRNIRSLLALLPVGGHIYSLPSYMLGLVLSVANSGDGPMAWLRGWPCPRVDVGDGDIWLGHVGIYPGVRLQCRGGGMIRVGDRSFINHDTQLRSCTRLTIGSECMISWNVLITDMRSVPAAGKENDAAFAPVSIGDNCWIGARALILGGTVLGDGCVVAAGSIVQGDFGAGRIIAGKPAA